MPSGQISLQTSTISSKGASASRWLAWFAYGGGFLEGGVGADHLARNQVLADVKRSSER